MYKSIAVAFVIAIIGFQSCSTAQTNSKFEADQFSNEILNTPNAVIIDVRTPSEFDQGHITGAQNIDWNSSNFEMSIEKVNKESPVFVYCLSGGRSSSAVSKMRALGFSNIYELKGGILKWRAANLPITTGSASSKTGMSKEQFDQLIQNEKLVLIDFYADWCKPCIKMKPFLEEINTEHNDVVTVIRINADENKELFSQLKLDALPVLQLYRNTEMLWNKVGFISKEGILAEINKY